MSQKSTFRISSAAAPYVGADKPRQDKLKAAAGKVELPPTDLVTLVYYLCHDADPEVKRTAVSTLRGLDVSLLVQVLANRELHPRILDALVQLHFRRPELAPLFAAHPMLSEKAARFLAQQKAAATQPGPSAAQKVTASAPAEKDAEDGSAPPEEAGDEDEGAVDETSEEFLSKYQMAQQMGVSEKIKMALTGDKEWRTLLIKESNKLVSGSVIKNPRITEGEVLTIAKSQVQNDEIMRVICANKDWIKNPMIRKALVWNHKTPLPAALRFIGTLGEKDLAQLAKSKNVSSAIASAARKILLSKKDGR